MKQEEKGKKKYGQISGISFPIYIGMLVILIVAMELGKIPSTMIGALAVLVLLGNLFHVIGNKLPIVRSYLGGGAVFCIFASACLATFGILPSGSVHAVKDFINSMGFLDFYIAALITGSVLGMNRKLLLRASIRYLPVVFISMISTFLMVGLVGLLIGNGFKESVLYVAFPLMAGGIGAGVVPLSSIYASGLHVPAAGIISQLIPASAFGNVLAIISAALLVKITDSSKKLNGHGLLMKTTGEEFSIEKSSEKPIEVTKIGVGFLVSVSFFLLGSILNSFIPQIHSYAFMIILVVICKTTGSLPTYYEECAVMFNQVIMKNLTNAVLAGIGIALLNLNVLAAALTWQFILLCVTSIVTIGVVSGIVGRLFGLYPVESAISAGFCNNSMGGTGNVAVLSAADRMELIAFAQMGNRLCGALVLIAGGFFIRLFF